MTMISVAGYVIGVWPAAHSYRDFEGAPSTRSGLDFDGFEAFQISDRVATPSTERLAIGLGGLSSLGLAVGGAALLITTDTVSGASTLVQAGIWSAVLAAPMVFTGLLVSAFRVALKRRFTLEFDKCELRVGAWHGWRRYALTQRHQFTMEEHGRAAREREEDMFAAQQAQKYGQSVRPRRIYADTYVLSLQVRGERIALLTVHGAEAARHILQRVNHIDHLLEEQARIGRAVALDGKLQMRRLAGSLGHDHDDDHNHRTLR